MIAQALICRPKLLLLDEPLANLDIRSAAEIVELLARIAAEQHVAILLSAHDMNPLLPVMDRVVYLADGRAAAARTERGRPHRHPQPPLRSPRRGDPRARPGAGGLRGRSPATCPGHPGRSSGLTVMRHWSSLFEPGFFSCDPVRTWPLGGVVAVVSGIVGVFTVIRGQSFAGHALSDIGTAGGSGAVLVGLHPLYGFVALT